ncbi:hypothetical protein BDZ89DRAFT_593845 [Hymenopellis radicata]|nr:hypothetical protein BDZ89DRAFT_593845 [Hymenopellis radicata]
MCENGRTYDSHYWYFRTAGCYGGGTGLVSGCSFSHERQSSPSDAIQLEQTAFTFAIARSSRLEGIRAFCHWYADLGAFVLDGCCHEELLRLNNVNGLRSSRRISRRPLHDSTMRLESDICC